MNIICVSHIVDNVGDIWRHPFSTSFSNGGLHYLHTAQRLSSSGRRRLLLLLAFDFTRSFQVHLVPDRVLVVLEERPLPPCFSSHMLHALLVNSISYLGQHCALRHFHKTDRLDPRICCLGRYPNIYVMHVWESVWKASAATAGFQQNFEQNSLLDEQNSEQTKKQN